jgi:hypothetical protein
MKNQNKTPKSLIFVFLLCACGAVFLNCEGNKEEKQPAPCVQHTLQHGDVVTEVTTKVSGRILYVYPCTDRISVAIELTKFGNGKYLKSPKINNIVMSLNDVGYK